MLIQQLHLFLDSEGFICCGGRVYNAPISQLTKLPIYCQQNILLLHSSSMPLMLNCVTVEFNNTVTALRQNYWVPTARQCVKGILRHCTTCKKDNGKPYTFPDPAPLPKSRLQDVHPFMVTGIDFTGHSTSETTVKRLRYMCVYLHVPPAGQYIWKL